MKKLLLIILIALFIPLSGFSETIKVLILDGSFMELPENNIGLGMLDTVRGELLIGYTRYKGNIEVWHDAKGIYLITEMPIEDYVAGVVEAELSDGWEIEAMKAQAVIARTYAIYQKLKNNAKIFHLTSTVSHQLFKGSNSEIKVSLAVRSTEGEILTFEDKTIEAFYHSTCGGKTESSEEVFGKNLPYLKPVKSECNISPYLIWSRDIPISEIELALGITQIKDVKIKSYTSTGRVREILVINNELAESVVLATNFRKMLGWKKLPSTNFTVRLQGNSVVFEGRGYGHGVGLCQWGALEMAKKGKKYREIISYYYPQTTIRLYGNKGL